jgi:ABC-type sugar transport system ATPase subunit
MVREPKVFLFDEPLSNLDAGLRAQMRIEIGGLQRRLNTTTVYVTHDQVEAMTLGDRIVVLADGRIQQIGRPIELYLSPVNRFVAGFIGTPAMNFVQGRIHDENGAATFIMEGAQVKVDKRALISSGSSEPITLGIRPEDLNVEFGSNGSQPSDDAFLGKIVLVERLGGTSHIHFEVGPHRLMASVVSDSLPNVGENISVRIPAARAHLFAADGRAM